jgi:hypothetical protein
MDLSLNINGNASGATAAFAEAGEGAGELGEAVGKSAVKWQELANVAKAAAAAVVKFGVDSVKAYAESEKIQRQLVRVSGDYADALGEQAEALSKLYAVDDDVIKQSQVLLTQWGGVGAASKEVTEAALNMAAAFGGDVNTATEDLIRNVESGGTGLAKMGIHFKATGDKGKDLAAAVAAINEKLGGAASANAASLTGSLESASLAFEDLQKSIGASITSFLSETGVINGVTGALRTLDEFITQKQTRGLLDEGLRQTDVMQAKLNLATAEQQLRELKASGGGDTLIRLFQTDVDNAQAALDKLVGSTKSLTLPGVESVTGRTNKALKGSDSSEDDIVGGNKRLGISAEYIQEKTAEVVDAMALQSLAIQEAQEKQFKAEQEAEKDQAAQIADIRAKAAEDQLRAADASYRDQRRLQDDALRKTLAQEQEWARAGNAIGAAFVTSLSNQLQRMMAGEDLDAGEVVANIIGDVLAVAGQVIGGAIGAAYGGNAQLGAAVGGAVGGLAGAGVKALGRAGRKPRQYHQGGPVGDEVELPRYHSGGYLAPDEVPMIGQKGEYMLSRQHVANMGGKAGVEQAINNGGRPQFSFTIQTIDAAGTRQFFENDGGRGFYNALRTGRGSLQPAFGGG